MMAPAFHVAQETAVWPPPPPLRELLLDADPDERQVADLSLIHIFKSSDITLDGTLNLTVCGIDPGLSLIHI